MNDPVSLHTALMNTRDLLMFLPLEAACLITVWPRLRRKNWLMGWKLAVINAAVYLLAFLGFLLLERGSAELFSDLIPASIFLWCFRRETDLSWNRLMIVFANACGLGGYSFLLYHVCDIFLHPDGSIYDVGDTRSLMVQIGFEVLVILLLRKSMTHSIRMAVFNYKNGKVFGIAWIVPLLFTASCRFAIPYYNSRMYVGRALRVYILFVLIIGAVAYASFALFIRVINAITENENLMEKALLVDMQNEQYRRLEQYLQETSRLRHDFRYQLRTLAQMLREGRVEEAIIKLEEADQLTTCSNSRYCSSPSVNALLNHYHDRFREARTHTDFRVSLSEEIFVEDLDLCVALGNLLENALLAAASVPQEKRNVFLMLGTTTDSIIAIQISNTYSVPVRKEAGRFLSSRHPGLGEGLRSVQLVAEKYDGEVRIEHDDTTFVVQVLLFRKNSPMKRDV